MRPAPSTPPPRNLTVQIGSFSYPIASIVSMTRSDSSGLKGDVDKPKNWNPSCFNIYNFHFKKYNALLIHNNNMNTIHNNTNTDTFGVSVKLCPFF